MSNFNYNVTGEKRKELVRAMSEILGEDASYQGAPSFAFKIDGYIVSRDGLVTCPDTAAREEIDRLVDALREQGFTPENVPEGNTPENASVNVVSENVPENAATDDGNRFSVEMPRAGFSEEAYGNLQKIIASKAELFKRALGTDTVDVEVLENKLRFPWFTLHGLEGEVDAYTKLIVGICDMAKRQKRVVARERAITNDKFTMRVFLIRLGFIGPEYQTARTLLLRNLTGNSSWLAGPPPERRLRRRNRKRLPPPPSPTLPFAKGCNLLEGLAAWLTSSGTILSDEQRSDEYNGVRIVTVRWQNQNYRIIQVDGMTCKIEQA